MVAASVAVIIKSVHFCNTCFFLGLTEDEDGLSRVAGSTIFTFQRVKRGHSMAQTGESLRSLLTQTLKHSHIICQVVFINTACSNLVLHTLFLCFCAQRVSWLGLLEKV